MAEQLKFLMLRTFDFYNLLRPRRTAGRSWRSAVPGLPGGLGRRSTRRRGHGHHEGRRQNRRGHRQGHHLRTVRTVPPRHISHGHRTMRPAATRGRGNSKMWRLWRWRNDGPPCRKVIGMRVARSTMALLCKSTWMIKTWTMKICRNGYNGWLDSCHQDQVRALPLWTYPITLWPAMASITFATSYRISTSNATTGTCLEIPSMTKACFELLGTSQLRRVLRKASVSTPRMWHFSDSNGCWRSSVSWPEP